MPSYTFTLPTNLAGLAATVYDYAGGARGSQVATGTVAADGTLTAQLATGDYLAVVRGPAGTETAVRDDGDVPVLAEDAAPDPNAVTGGESTIRREDAITSLAITSGQLRLGYFTARQTRTISTLRISCVVAAGATPTLIRIGVYSVDSAGNLTLVGATPNDTTLLAVGFTSYAKAVSVPFQVKAGARYAAGSLVVTAASVPNVSARQLQIAGSETFAAPTLCTALNGQSDLPSSIAVGSLAQASTQPYVVLL